ncbi:MAG: chemotaxis protein CheW [Candidatus Raymondbacteria bacterium RifOxyA12_full_50_37]|uniref:Chemotaxis protein CheW n=1 Tax=Candidatus Raymondbacteria bacterium RIFOXYD12_FULL_49_13 TaxID=1817890 RepID=A0A1F7F322_UNCRA|nr:MAG: chemotaxis protein CheW [Candidatus Raymondbacteria bacterium RIFOXYA2_FULL_49_16]OGJ90135.1 MAG: chemotaxis protein CheW [Candidatus Raymondbacteria bacterium RifOxyA12_full_50_37]OGJ94670.1 MAG: chemotaxis protein CheW [Candidatus Raymondbacteria bacterium RifOxyB12_full_50_8]OGJ97720.1 MAG: chemotaxis protein CheW [Candidatus Raymondbacteria bacterium RIFOXYC2_FULL_50_21]OGK01060.1 MAG: chemotaxis protein CheW [Candidatus Raymondbacteria bacterium RIFOXYD12_FULL_49_13]OGP43670.1 MAG
MAVAQKSGQREGASDKRAGKYLTFRLEDEEYGLEILKVREIIGLMDITHIPRTPDWVRGVINLRGKVIPVVDTRLKFGMKALEDTVETCIIVVEVKKAGEALEMGILVDAVSEVLDITAQEIEDTPEFGAGLDTQFILGMAKAKGGVKILLDIDKVLTEEDIIKIQTTADNV